MVDSKEAIEGMVLRVLSSRPEGLTFEELVEEVGWMGDARPLRAVVAELVRRGIIVKVPDHGRRKIVFKVHGSRLKIF